MARPLRIDFPGAFHHITNRGARRQAIFYCDEDRLDFLDLVERAHQRFGILVHAFALMNNHIHLIVETPEGDLSRALHLIEGTYVQRFNRRHELDGPLFKDRFYSRLIQEDTYLERAVRYVERNPLEAGIVEDLLTYPWSSFRLFVEGSHAMPPWLTAGALDGAGIKTAKQLSEFVYSKDHGAHLDLDTYGPAVGDDDFIAAALERSSPDNQTIGHVRAARIRPTAADVEHAVSIVFDVEPSLLRMRSQGTRAAPRLAAIGLVQDIAGQSLGFIAERFGFSSAQSAGVIASRFRRQEGEDEVFALKVEQVKQLLLDGRMPRPMVEDLFAVET